VTEGQPQDTGVPELLPDLVPDPGAPTTSARVVAAVTLSYGCDSAAPPSVADLLAIYANGWRDWYPYLGGPRCFFSSNGVGLGSPGRAGFSNGTMMLIQNHGFLLRPPIYVGRTSPYDPPEAFTYEQGLADGDDANWLMGGAGFNETQPMCLDAEYGDWQNEPTEFMNYLGGFVERANQIGHQVMLYSDMATLDAIPDDGSMVDFKWGAAYGKRPTDAYDPITHRPPFGMYNPGTPPPWQAWQFARGSTYDVDSAISTCPYALCIQL
jgi:hypothetical protein